MNMSNKPEDIWAMAAGYWAAAQPLMPMYGHLIISALFPIYTGAHASLSRPASAAKRSRTRKETDTDDDGEEEEEEVVQKMEGLTASDAIVFPITAALMLAGLYYLITRYGAQVINLVLSWYFAAIGTYSVGRFINDGINVAVTFFFPKYFASRGTLFKVEVRHRHARPVGSMRVPIFSSPSPLYLGKTFSRIAWNSRSNLKQRYALKIFVQNLLDLQANLGIINVISAILGLLSIVYANLNGKPWWLTNLQGFAVCYSAMQLMSPTTFATGSLILGALFFYDIWAVFFTPLMVTVATNLDQPIKLLFPKPDQPSSASGDPPIRNYSMLGLGDIVLPGLMIGLALRFDLYMHYLKKQTKVVSPSQVTGNSEKAEYIPVTGRWGDCFWTASLTNSHLPNELRLGFAKPYFVMSLVGYVIGMITTLAVMTVFQHAQPALLYLVPGVLISIWSTAVARGEIKQMWDYSEAMTGEQIDKDGEIESKKDTPTSFQGSEDPSNHSWWHFAGLNLFERGINNTSKSVPPGESSSEPKKAQASSSRHDGVVFSVSLSHLERVVSAADESAKIEPDSNRSTTTGTDMRDNSKATRRAYADSGT